MKKFIVLSVLLMLSACTEIGLVSRTVVQKDIIPAHEEIYTENEYDVDLWGDGSFFKKYPQTKSRWVKETYELTIEVLYDNGTKTYETEQVNRNTFDLCEVGNIFIDGECKDE